ncbi:MAG: response regulator [[Clostridium] scindens]
MYKVIIIDDEPWTIVDIEQTFALDDMGFEIIDSFRTPQKALPAIVAKKPDLVITDIRMPGMTGLELMQKGQAAAYQLRIHRRQRIQRFLLRQGGDCLRSRRILPEASEPRRDGPVPEKSP